MTTTPYMSLDLPVPEVTLGPEWAEDLNVALELVDSHDHTPGKGASLTQLSLTINGDLEFNDYSITELHSSRFATQLSALVGINDKGCVYNLNGNLYYNNNAGVAVQITNGGSIASVGSGIISAFSPGAYPYTVLSSNAQQVIVVDTSAARTLNLPAASTAMFFMVKDGVGSAQTNNVSVVPDGTDTIDSANTTYVLDYNFGCIGFVSDGISKWHAV